jgi:hypothetical protein
MKTLIEIDAMTDKERKQYARVNHLCEYCYQAKAEGYVRAYDAYVCEECHEDHHGIN